MTKQLLYTMSIIILLCAMFLYGPAATASTSVPDKIPSRLIVTPYHGPNGHYDIYVEKQGEWLKAGRLSYIRFFGGQNIGLDDLVTDSKEARIKIVQVGGEGLAHIDAAMLGDAPPTTVDGLKTDSDLTKLQAVNNDVVDATKRTLTFTFPKKRKNNTLVLTARVEPDEISKEAFKFPSENDYRDIVPDSPFYTYALGSNIGRLNMRGDFSDLSGEQPLFKILSKPGTGHPDAYTVGYIRNDAEFLYAVVEFNADNTLDGDADYAKLFVKVDDTVREFKLSEKNTKWGAHHFIYTNSVGYQHKYYEFKIPLTELGVKTKTEKLALAFSAYGTAGNNITNPAAGLSLPFGEVVVGEGGAIHSFLPSVALTLLPGQSPALMLVCSILG